MNKELSYKEALEKAYTLLKETGIESYILDSQVLLEEATGKDRIYFYSHGDKNISSENYNKFQILIKRRLNREPVAYILGEKEFMGLLFKVEEGILVPRPDTEIIVEAVLELIKDNAPTEVLDLCCGSGAIGLSIKNYKPASLVTLADVSSKATQVTRRNAETLNLDVNVIHSDLFNKIKKSFDIIVSNPPYIKSEEISTLEEEIKNWEPRLALDGGLDGYLFYKRIIKESSSFLRPGGYLVFEIGINQDQDIIRFLEEANFESIEVKNDLSGIPRAVIAQKKKE